MLMTVVRAEMNNAINHKHAVEDGKREAAQEIAKLPPAERADPCKTAPIYNGKHQLAEAKRDYIACDKRGGPPYWKPGNMALILARLALDTNDVALMKSSLARLEKEDPAMYRQIGQYWENAVGDE